MKSAFLSFLVCVAIGVASCVYMRSDSSMSYETNVRVIFLDHNHTPEEQLEVYVLETFGNVQKITEVRQTNSNGEIDLQGHYCLPVIVAANGGGVAVQRHEQAKYEVLLRADRHPSLTEAYGTPTGNLKTFSDSTHRKNCG